VARVHVLNVNGAAAPVPGAHAGTQIDCLVGNPALACERPIASMAISDQQCLRIEPGQQVRLMALGAGVGRWDRSSVQSPALFNVDCASPFSLVGMHRWATRDKCTGLPWRNVPFKKVVLTDGNKVRAPYDSTHALRIVTCGTTAGEQERTVHDRDDNPEQQYESSNNPAMSYVVLSVLLAVVCFIAAMAAWTSA
jgi:hypothetical protein